MAKKILFKLLSFEPLPLGKGRCPRWKLRGETIEGDQLVMTTAVIGKSELRWHPRSVQGETLRVTYHRTRSGTLMADLWRPSWAEGEDLAAQFAMARTRYLVEQERQALAAEVPQKEVPLPDSTPRLRL